MNKELIAKIAKDIFSWINRDIFDIKVLKVTSKFFNGRYVPFVKIEWTPFEVYGHVPAYDVLQKDIRKILKRHKVREIDTLTSKKFKDIGWEISLQLNATEKDVKLLENDLKELVGKVYKNK